VSPDVVALLWLASAVAAGIFLGTCFHRCDKQPTPARPMGSANHPSGRRMGCPDAIAVDLRGQIIEVFL
jgi:hypothetical protein